MIGIEEREHNGFHILRLNYTADPAKRAPEWPETTRKALGLSERQWRREFEGDWTVASGLAVYADEFNREFHVAKGELMADPRTPVYRGWDFGLTPACVWAQLDGMGRINILMEHIIWDGRGEMKQMGIERFAPAIVVLSNQWFPDAKWIDYADPAGWSKAQTDERSCVDILHDNKIHPRPGAVTFTARKSAMVQTLGQHIGGRAKLLISPECSMLIEGFEGAYRYEEIGETGRYRETVEKNAWSHPMDSLEYLVAGIFASRSKADDDDERPKKRLKRDPWTGY